MSIGAVILEVWKSLTDFLFPPVCLLCGGECRGEEKICGNCAAIQAERALRYESPPRKLEHVNEVCVLLPYDESCRTLVHAFKYHGMPSVAEMAGRLMSRKALARFPDFGDALLVPVPLHPKKLRERGYNQCGYLAEGFSLFSGHTVRNDLIERTVYTGTQTALNQNERKRNVQGAFSYAGTTSLSGRKIILIDDVMTTGSTLSECARVLAEAGAAEIAVCVVATPDVGEK